MKSYIGFIILVLIVGFIIYIVVKSDKMSDYFSFGFSPRSTSTPTERNVKVGTPSVITGDRKGVRESPESEVTPPEGFTRNQLSPYYEKVRISSVSRGYYSKTSNIKLSVSNISESVNVTGWRIVANRGDVLTVPKAVNDYNPNRTALEKDIILGSGEYLNLYNTETPLGFNLRLNKCAGYLNNFYTFEPTLPNNCPRVDRAEISALSGSCQSFINSLSSCRQPTGSQINEFSAEAACRRFLDTLSYGNCYERYRYDADFFSKEWRAWLWRRNFDSSNIDADHDRLLLFDKTGLLVDEYVY